MDEQPTRIYELGDEKAWSDVVGNGRAEPVAADAQLAPAHGRKAKTLATGAGLVLGGVLLGTVAVSAAQGLGDSPDATAAASRTQGGAGLGAPNPGTAQQQQPQQQQGFGGRGGGLGGEQRLSGTIVSVSGSSISVTTSVGTASYAVTGQTEILKDGQPVVLSALKSGDAVFLHVYPAGSGMAIERLFVGNPPTGGPGPGGAPTGTAGRNT